MPVLKENICIAIIITGLISINRDFWCITVASLYEDHPGSVIEAMSMRKPLLLSRIEEQEEVAKKNEKAIFFAPEYSENLSEKIEQF